MRRLKAVSRHAMFIACLVSVALFLATSCAPGAPVEEAPAVDATVYEGARLIVGDGSAPIENASFVVQGGVFTVVGATADVDVPVGATRVDLTGKTVMPAIIDAHKHVAGTREELVDQLQRMAYYGVGMVLSLGLDETDLAAQVQNEAIPGAARLLTAGRGMTGEEPGRSQVPYWLTTEDEARAAVTELAGTDVDLIKIWVDDRNGQYQKLTPELYGAVIDEAHANNLRVTAHIFALEDAKGLVEAGIDAFAHGVRDQDVDDEFVEMVQARPNLFMVPNMPDRGVAVDMSWLSGTLTAEQVADLQAGATDRPAAQEGFGIQARNLDRLNQAGMQVAFGTDGPTPWAPHVEMVDMVASGMTPAEVLVAATSTSAALLAQSDLGSVAAGKRADFIVLDANPLDDITNTRQIDSVYLGGSAIDRAALSSQWVGEAGGE
jgi:imidazolonepropionase-like amidohydrolase